jgi:hypothetical protein
VAEGVPQSSGMGPLQFIMIIINDIFSCVIIYCYKLYFLLSEGSNYLKTKVSGQSEDFF